MWMIGPVGFTAPLLLLGLVVLPLLWLILRAVPPAPIKRRFPGVALLLGLRDEDVETERTPWWLLALRMAAIGAAIVAFAGPVLNPDRREAGTGPVLILLDGSWADARDWPRRVDRATAVAEAAGREGRTVAVVRLTDTPGEVAFTSAGAALPGLAAMMPQPWVPDYAAWAKSLPEGGFETHWMSDGLDHPGRADLLKAVEGRGEVTVFESPRPVIALRPAEFKDGATRVTAVRLPAGDAAGIEVAARGLDPAGIERELARAPLAFKAGEAEGTADLTLPPELRNRISRFEVVGQRSAGAVSLTDDSLKRRKVALIAGQGNAEELRLLSPTHYLRQALQPVAELIDGTLSDVIQAAPDVIVLADVARPTDDEAKALQEWVEKGGLLLRFAGPRLAASDVSRVEEDPLMPVRLREGGRSLGGAMSWGDPRRLAPFPPTSPFYGLHVPEEVTVTQQVLAQPDPDLADRTIAALADGTPLVTRKTLGRGQVVLFHVTANAEWSNLPLSGLYVEMLERLAVSSRPLAPGADDLKGQVFVPQVALDAFGALVDAGEKAGVEGEALGKAIAAGPSAALPPGLYAGDDRRVALNAFGTGATLAPAFWPDTVRHEGMEGPAEQSLKGSLLAAALALLMADILAALYLSGRLVRGLGGAAVALLIAVSVPAPRAVAQTAPAPEAPMDPAAEAAAIAATSEFRLAYVITGDKQVDDISAAGLLGLSQRLFERTTIEPAAPIGVNIETDELLFFPFIYWPISTGEPMPSAAAYAKLNRYLHTGGMILFDTRDGDMSGSASTPEAAMLQRLAAPLDIPPLEILPEDHVLTRSFYLLQDFPGRYDNPNVWVEAAPPDAEKAEGMPFRNLNDGVTPVVIGGNDWASAWAVDEYGAPLLPVGRGYGGERQREIATRFGINLIMHVLTGNYKSDQVHVPALLERLGQ